MNTLDLQLNNIFIPSKVPSKKLMIILHGRGDSSQGFNFLPAYLDIEDLNYLLLDAPYEYFGGRSWYDLPPNQLEGIQYSSKILSVIFDELFQNDFDAKQSILFGFSQGSLLTFEFGSRYHNALAGYIAISGYIYDETQVLKELNKDVLNARWLCTHGTYDNVLAYDTSKKQIDFLQTNNFPIHFESYEKEHNIDSQEILMIKSWILETLASKK
jgi:phospholipase/carboxylesterase